MEDELRQNQRQSQSLSWTLVTSKKRTSAKRTRVCSKDDKQKEKIRGDMKTVVTADKVPKRNTATVWSKHVSADRVHDKVQKKIRESKKTVVAADKVPKRNTAMTRFRNASDDRDKVPKRNTANVRSVRSVKNDDCESQLVIHWLMNTDDGNQEVRRRKWRQRRERWLESSHSEVRDDALPIKKDKRMKSWKKRKTMDPVKQSVKKGNVQDMRHSALGNMRDNCDLISESSACVTGSCSGNGMCDEQLACDNIWCKNPSLADLIKSGNTEERANKSRMSHYHCDECNLTMVTQDDLRRHIESHDKAKVVDLTKDKGKGRYYKAL